MHRPVATCGCSEPGCRSLARRRMFTALAALLMAPVAPAGTAAGRAEARWMDAARAMRQRALGWGDQPYGAVLVLGDAIVGEGPSRVVLDRNPDAHAERVAIADAQRRLGRQRLDGAVLYSTSRPCALCEAAAAGAGVARMIHGVALNDAGAPRAD